MKKIYISGCGGMLGDSFYQVFSKNYKLKCTDINLIDEWLSYLDFRNYEEYRNEVLDYKPDYLFHLGAHTDLEFCENNVDDAYKTNTLSVEHASNIANELGIPLLYISTAGIFDGEKSFYDDWDIPKPLGHYARSKYIAEQYVQTNTNQYLICRAGWMMGGGIKKDKKFVNKIIKQIRENKKELFVVNDKLGTPTYTLDFANNVELLIQNKKRGLYNLVCEGHTSRLEVAKEILKILNLEDSINITEVDSNFFKKEYFAARPNSEMLINYKLNLLSLNIMRDWKICLVEYINSQYKQLF
tara:strand:+ start:922 stop:1818 length:897 start_codon:yes stop_codon:yes gene_type:complete